MKLLFLFLKLWYSMTFNKPMTWTIECWFKGASIYIDGRKVTKQDNKNFKHIAIVRESNGKTNR